MDKLSYALGLSMGNNFKGSGIKSITIQDFTAGMEAVYTESTPAMSMDEAKEVINAFFSELQAEMTEQNTAIGTKFLEENKKRAGVVTLDSGLQYEIMTEGTGRKPSATDKVKCHYVGSLLNGQVFDSSVARGEPATFGVNQVIAGWVEALQLMSEGAKWKLFIPSQLAYGEHGAGEAIAPNATLIFEVELIEVV